MATRLDMINRVADILGVSAAGQTLPAEDADTIGTWYDATVALLERRGLAYLNDTDDVPLDMVVPLARAVAVEAGPSFGLSRAAVLERIGMTYRQIEGALTELASDRPTFQTLRTNYF